MRGVILIALSLSMIVPAASAAPTWCSPEAIVDDPTCPIPTPGEVLNEAAALAFLVVEQAPLVSGDVQDDASMLMHMAAHRGCGAFRPVHPYLQATAAAIHTHVPESEARETAKGAVRSYSECEDNVDQAARTLLG